HGLRARHCQQGDRAARGPRALGRHDGRSAGGFEGHRSVPGQRGARLMLRVEGLNQFYGQSHTLWDVSFDVEEGSCMCVMGRNGVGKTTLMRVIMGLLKAKSGSVKFDGKELVGRAAEVRPRVGIAYVPQGREIFAQLSVEENLRVGLVTGRHKD